MKAALFKGAGQKLSIETVADPVPGPGDLVLAVKACGICGSDLHATEAGPFTLPSGTIMGHEFAGEVVAVGAEAAGRFRVGQLVTALPYIACGRCDKCLTGRGHRCAASVSTGLGQTPGAYAEFVRVGGAETLILPEGIGARFGAMVEPLAVGLHAVEEARLEKGARVLILGAGPVGLSVALWARFFGARDVVVSDLVASRRDLSLKMGATATIDDPATVADAFARIAGAPPDVIFECVGVPGILQHCLMMAAPDTTIVVVGVCSQPDTIMPLVGILKEVTLRFVLAYRRQDFAYVIDMLAAERIDPSPMISDVVGFAGFADAFEALRRPSHQCKVLLEPTII